MLVETLFAPLLAASAPLPPPPPPVSAPTVVPSPGAPSVCPADMEHVHGVHYEQVERLCLDVHEKHCFTFLPGLLLREPRTTTIDVCMDRYEWPNRVGAKPQVMLRFVEAEAACASLGKRLCSEAEWELGCEGPHTLPWPYGFAWRHGVCNTDLPFRPYDERRLMSEDEDVRVKETGRLWQGATSGSFPGCRSPFGVFDLVGNVEEWVTASRPQWPYRSALKGGYWSKPWAACRGTNERHGPSFRYYEIGFRCCREPGRP
jgi:hypothetical protein